MSFFYGCWNIWICKWQRRRVCFSSVEDWAWGHTRELHLPDPCFLGPSRDLQVGAGEPGLPWRFVGRFRVGIEAALQLQVPGSPGSRRESRPLVEERGLFQALSGQLLWWRHQGKQLLSAKNHMYIVVFLSTHRRPSLVQLTHVAPFKLWILWCLEYAGILVG